MSQRIVVGSGTAAVRSGWVDVLVNPCVQAPAHRFPIDESDSDSDVDSYDGECTLEPPHEVCYAPVTSPPLVCPPDDAAAAPPLVPIPAGPARTTQVAFVASSPRWRDELELETVELVLPSCPSSSPVGSASPARCVDATPPQAALGTLGVHLKPSDWSFAWMREHLGGPRTKARGGGAELAAHDVTLEVPNAALLQRELHGLVALCLTGAWLPPAPPHSDGADIRCAADYAEDLTDALLDSVQVHYAEHYVSPGPNGRRQARDCGRLAWQLGHASVVDRVERARLAKDCGGGLLELLGSGPPRALPPSWDDVVRVKGSGWQQQVERLVQPSSVEALHQALFGSDLLRVACDGQPHRPGYAPHRRAVALVTNASPTRLNVSLGWTHGGPQRWRGRPPGAASTLLEGVLFAGLALEVRREPGDVKPHPTEGIYVSDLWISWQGPLSANKAEKKAGKKRPGPLPLVSADGNVS